MSKWVAEFDLEDGDKMPEHMDLNYMGAKIDFHCRPMWIPVSERMPEEHKRVLVSDVFGIYIGEFIDAEESWGGKHFVNEHGMRSKSVIAWMPLPELYKAGGEDA